MNAFAEEITEAKPGAAAARDAITADWSAELLRVSRICERAAKGDLEARITGVEQHSEFGALCHSINHMLDMADSFVREAAAAMEECSHDRFHRPILLRGLKGAYRESARVINQAGVKMQGSHQRLLATARLASDTASNVGMVAAACEQLTASNGEISRQAAASAAQTEKAVAQSQRAAAVVREMSAATKNIEGIVTLITKFAGETNLLALNATIEAAHAGEHGRGFAVVANEVKELARNSAKATADIGRQIESVQSTVKHVVELIEGVGAAIQGINGRAADIARSVHEQVQATDDISRNISQVSQKTGEISANMNQSAA